MTREFDAYNKRKQTSYSRRVQEERRSLQWALSKVEDRLSLSGFISFCRRSKVLDIPPLAGLTSLIHLNMKGTDVDDISPLEGLTSVVHLDISNTDVDRLRKVCKVCPTLFETRMKWAFLPPGRF
jgi:hypothetical protein